MNTQQKIQLENLSKMVSEKAQQYHHHNLIRELYKNGAYEKSKSSSFNSFRDQLDTLSMNTATSAFFICLLISINIFISYRFSYIEGIWIPCLILIAYFFYTGTKKAKEEKLKCLEHFNSLEKEQVENHLFLLKIKSELESISKEINLNE